MKAIIMAAGIGSRLKKRLGSQPKCCTEVGGETLIGRLLRLLREKGIRDIVLVLGYEGEQLRRQLGESPDLRCYLNPFYPITNSISSLWFAREELDGSDDAMILNGDLFFEPRLLDEAMASAGEVVMLADPRRVEEADYRFGYEQGLLRRFGKNLTPGETTGEYVGIAKLERSAIPGFRARLQAMVEGQQQHGLWWEDVLYGLCREGMPVRVAEVVDCFWAELDYIEDYDRIQEFLRRSATAAAMGASAA